MSNFFDDEKWGISPDRRRWLNTRQRDLKNTAVRTTKVANREREDALMWARKFIKREDIVKDDEIERRYLIDLHRYINEFGFNAEALNVSDDHFNRVLLAGQTLAAPEIILSG